VAALRKFETEELPKRQASLEKAWLEQPGRYQVALVDCFARGLKWSALARWSSTADPDWRKLKRSVLDHQAKAPKPRIVKAMISSEGLPPVRLHTQGDDFLKETHFLNRGDPNQKEGTAP